MGKWISKGERCRGGRGKDQKYGFDSYVWKGNYCREN